MIRKILSYLSENLLQGALNSPLNSPLKAFCFLPVYVFFALWIGFKSGLLYFNPISSDMRYFLVITLFVMPSLLEEILFRGVMIPLNTYKKSKKHVFYYLIFSTLLYVAWHPFNALVNPISAVFFMNPYFLTIVFLLGITCGISYIYSRSLWAPVIIHWITVVVWVIFLGGRNMILD